MAAGAVGRAQPALGVLGIEPHVHARLVVGRGDQLLEGLQDLVFELGREGVVAPGFTHLCLRLGAVALRQVRAGEREAAFGGERRFLGEVGHHGRGIGPLVPEHCLGAAAQRADAGPARIGGDEIGVAGEVGAVVVAAQNRPFGELACDRIAHRALKFDRSRGVAFAREREGLLERGDVDG